MIGDKGNSASLCLISNSAKSPVGINQPTTITMSTPKDLTKNQKETLKQLLLKQKEWEKNKQQIKTAKKKSTSKTKLS